MYVFMYVRMYVCMYVFMLYWHVVHDFPLHIEHNTSQASLAVKLQHVTVSAKGIYDLLLCKTDSSLIFIRLLFYKVFSSIIYVVPFDGFYLGRNM